MVLLARAQFLVLLAQTCLVFGSAGSNPFEQQFFYKVRFGELTTAPILRFQTCAREACAIQTAAGAIGLRDGPDQPAQNRSARSGLRRLRWAARWVAQRSCAEQVCASGAAQTALGLREICSIPLTGPCCWSKPSVLWKWNPPFDPTVATNHCTPHSCSEQVCESGAVLTALGLCEVYGTPLTRPCHLWSRSKRFKSLNH